MEKKARFVCRIEQMDKKVINYTDAMDYQIDGGFLIIKFPANRFVYIREELIANMEFREVIIDEP